MKVALSLVLTTLLLVSSALADEMPKLPLRTVIFNENGTSIECTITRKLENSIWIIPAAGTGGWFGINKLHPLSRVALGLGSESDKQVYAVWKAEQDKARAEEIERQRIAREEAVAAAQKKALEDEKADRKAALELQRQQIEALDRLNQQVEDARIYAEVMQARAQNRPYYLDTVTSNRIFSGKRN